MCLCIHHSTLIIITVRWTFFGVWALSCVCRKWTLGLLSNLELVYEIIISKQSFPHLGCMTISLLSNARSSCKAFSFSFHLILTSLALTFPTLKFFYPFFPASNHTPILLNSIMHSLWWRERTSQSTLKWDGILQHKVLLLKFDKK